MLPLPPLAVLRDTERQLGNVPKSIFPQTTMFADAVWFHLIKHKQQDLLHSLPPSDGGMSSARPGVSAKSRGGHIIAFLLRLPQLPHLGMLCLRASCCGILGIPQRTGSRIAPPRTSRPGARCWRSCRLAGAAGCIPGIDR